MKAWRISKARKEFVEKKVVEWGFPAAITALGYFVARSVGLYDPATFAVLGPLSTIVASKAVSAFQKSVEHAGILGTTKIVADIDASASEREIRKLLQKRDRYLIEGNTLPTIGVPISSTGTALDGTEFTMPVDMLELMYEDAAVEAEHQAEANMSPMRRRELARARFTLDHQHHDGLIDQFQHFRFRPEIDRQRAQAVTMVFASEAEALAAKIVEDKVIEMALHEGREQAIDAVGMRLTPAANWASTPEWWRQARLGPAVRPRVAPLESETPDLDIPAETVDTVLADLAAAQVGEAETMPATWELD